MTIGKIGEFNIHTDNWNRYVERIEHYFEANKVDSSLQVSTFITVIGAECYELLVNLCTPDNPKTKTFTQLTSILADHLQPKPSILAERYKFRSRKQNVGELIKDYVAVLKKMSALCDFGTTLQDNLRDQFACGISSETIRQRLFAEDKLSFQRALQLAISLEAAEKDAAAVIGGRVDVGETNNVEVECQAMRSRAGRSAGAGTSARAQQPGAARRGWRPARPGGSGGSVPTAPQARRNPKCRACGAPHDVATCQFTRYVCRVCNRLGHLQRVCPNLSRQYNVEVASGTILRDRGEEDSDEVILNMNHLRANLCPPIRVALNINGVDVMMECDTGSAVSCISYKLYKSLFKNLDIQPSNLTLRYYTGELVTPVGVVRPLVKYKGRAKLLDLYVVNDGKTVLLGRQWLLELDIQVQVTKCGSVNHLDSEEFNLAEFSSRYCEVFADGLGRFTGGTVGIHLREGARPVFLRARPLAYALREPVERALDQLVSDGILTPVDRSDWATPIVPVVKKDGSIRICADYKLTLNKVLIVDRYPLPKVEDLLARLHGGKRFSKIDLSQAYAQFELDDSNEYTVINTHKGLFRYNRLVYGLSSSPGIFQKKLEQLFADLPYVGVFLDDVIISGRDTKEHIENLHKVFMRLKTYGLRVRKDKCTFFARSVNYLGHVISEEGVHTCPGKVAAINNTPAPTTVSELRAFIGMVMYYGKFIHNVSSILTPLYNLLRAGVQYVWDGKCQAAFEEVKRRLGSSEVLMHYAPELPLVLTADASGVGVGAVISQLTPAGERPVAYASRTLTRAERAYAQIDREALAIIFGIRKFHQYLYGRKFILRSDHKPLTYIFGAKVGIPVMAASRIQRWAILLSGYSYDIEYVPSTKNCADALSRLPQSSSRREPEESKEITYLNFVEDFLPVTNGDLRTATRKDRVLSRVLAHVQSGWPAMCPGEELQPYFARRNELYLDRDCIMWGYRIVVPVELQHSILKQLHASHMGIVKTKCLARSYVWWPNVDKDVEATCESCETCAAEAQAPPRAPPQPWQYVPRVWSRVHIDFLGPLEGKTFLVLIDSSSKWLEVEEMSRTNAASVIKFLRATFARFGLPLEVVSDQGPPFSSTSFKDFLTLNGIRQSWSPTYHPASNGAAENAVKLCKRAIKKAARDRVDVETALQTYLLAYRNSKHSTTGESPAMLLQRRNIRSRLDLLRSDAEREYRVADAQQKQVEAAGGVSRAFAEGDTVWARNYRGPDKWLPGKVLKCEGSRTYLVKKGDGRLMSTHVDQIRRRSQRASLSYPAAEQATDRTRDNAGEGSEDYVMPVGEEMTSAGAVQGEDSNKSLEMHSPGQKGLCSPCWGTPTMIDVGGSRPSSSPHAPSPSAPEVPRPAIPPVLVRDRPKRIIRPPCRFGFDDE